MTRRLVLNLGIVVILSLLAFAGAFVLSATLLREPLLQARHTPVVLREIVQIFVPRRELYSHLAELEISTGRTGEWTFQYTNKYVGPCSFGVILGESGADAYWGNYQTTLRTRVEFYVKNVLALSHEDTGEFWDFFTGAYNGFMLVHYECPKDLPVNVPITVKVTIIEPDPELQTRFGPIKLYVARDARD